MFEGYEAVQQIVRFSKDRSLFWRILLKKKVYEIGAENDGAVVSF